MKIVRGHHPEARCAVRSLVNGALLDVTVSAAATFIVQGTAELVGDMTPELVTAIDTYKRIHCVARTL